jgi:8-oxo-dGTP diphosphatase
MCTPSLAIDAIIELKQHSQGSKIVLVRRRDPPRNLHAIVGGFVDVGETIEAATIREVKEETNITLTLDQVQQFRMYSDPKRDKRRHTVSMVSRCLLVAEAADKALQELHTGDDAKQAAAIHLRDVTSLDLAFDHRLILTDFINQFHPNLARTPRS